MSKSFAFRASAVIGAAVLLLAGCAPAPAKPGENGTGEQFCARMVTNSGGLDDRSFNDASWKGLQDAADEFGIGVDVLVSNSETDLAPNVQQAVDTGCGFVLTVGYELADATADQAGKNPDVDFAIVDEVVDAPNVKPIVFDTAQAAFLAGYASASYSKAGTVGTFGGIGYPTVTIFMDGFAQGVDYFNKQKGKSVKVLGYDPANPKAAAMTGGFDANDTAKTVAQNLIDQGADVIFPVGGPIFQSAGAAITDSGKPIALLGADADVFDTFPKYDSLYLTSVLKGMKPAVNDVVTAAAKGNFDPAPYLGTLKNGGVGIAPFHDYKSKVAPSLQGELDKIKASIISGDIKVKSYLAAS